MKLVAYNTQYCKGKDGRIDVDRVVKSVADADLIAFQEIERHWKRSGEMDQPAEIARRLPKHHWAYGPYFDADASTVAADGTVTVSRNGKSAKLGDIAVGDHVRVLKDGTNTRIDASTAAFEKQLDAQRAKFEQQRQQQHTAPSWPAA